MDSETAVCRDVLTPIPPPGKGGKQECRGEYYLLYVTFKGVRVIGCLPDIRKASAFSLVSLAPLEKTEAKGSFALWLLIYIVSEKMLGNLSGPACGNEPTTKNQRQT